MPNRCVAGHCGNLPNIKLGVVLHSLPFYNDERPVAKRRRRQWVDFVRAKRAKWEPTQSSKLCSAHFKPEDFMRRYHMVEGQSGPVLPRLLRDEIGVVPVPTVHAIPQNQYGGPENYAGPSTSHARRRNRQASNRLIIPIYIFFYHPEPHFN